MTGKYLKNEEYRLRGMVDKLEHRQSRERDRLERALDRVSRYVVIFAAAFLTYTVVMILANILAAPPLSEAWQTKERNSDD